MHLEKLQRRTAVCLVELLHHRLFHRLGLDSRWDALELDKVEETAANLNRVGMVILLFIGWQCLEEALRDDVLPAAQEE